MEVNCPSCGSMHRSEDYPGAFDILCGCGYLILNPEIGSGGDSDYNEINFEGPPAVAETSVNERIKIHKEEDPLELSLIAEAESSFSAQNLTPPEELPDDMLYDPGELPADPLAEKSDSFAMSDSLDMSQNPEVSQIISAKKESTLSRIFVERIQRASIGQILGPDFDLEFSDLDPPARLKARERIEKFLQDHKWLSEEMQRRSFVLSEAFQTEKIYGVPEALAVEMYIACLENGGRCLFIRHQQLSA